MHHLYLIKKWVHATQHFTIPCFYNNSNNNNIINNVFSLLNLDVNTWSIFLYLIKNILQYMKPSIFYTVYEPSISPFPQFYSPNNIIGSLKTLQ